MKLPEGIFLSDGGMGTLLEQRGLRESCPELLNLTHYREMAAIHREYAEAGAQFATANTFGLNLRKAGRLGLADKLPEMAEAGVRAAKEGAPGCLIGLDIGPVGDFCAPYGGLTFSGLGALVRPALEAGIRAGADFAMIETQCDLTEARRVGLEAKALGLPFILSFTFEDNGRTLMGNTPACCAVAAEALGAAAAGVNCSGGPGELLPVVKAMARAASLPLLVQPNAGLPRVEEGVTLFPYGPEAMASLMAGLLEAGADGIGGCCGTTPAHISAMRPLTGGPRSARGVPLLLSSRRLTLPAEDAFGDFFTYACAPGVSLSDTMDDWMDDCAEAAALCLDIRRLSPGEIAALLDEEQDLPRKCLLFLGEAPEQVTAALTHYCGRAGVLGDPPLRAAAEALGGVFREI
ncbi:MAG: homocysteine S-methyltransferase family protein [Christensenellales bacterium]|jgi:5-methyltetrahydrofolate--homocysteine methyltransferase